MSSPLIAGLRSVSLIMPDLQAAERFYTEVWRLRVVARTADTIYLRGTGTDHHLLSLSAAASEQAAPQIRHVTLRAHSLAALDEIASATLAAGGTVIAPVSPSIDPSGGISLTIADPAGRIFEIVHGDHQHSDNEQEKDSPIRLAHTVLNSDNVASAQPFFEQALGFRLIDRTVIMAFLNCNNDHHSIALGISDNNALNHIAFVMPSVDSVMRGGGRMRDAGHAIEWGPGRHGPGNNTFNYFIDPFGVVIEYTADVEQVDNTYKVRMPEDWKWPPGRVDQWGISQPPSARLKQAQKEVAFAPIH